MLDVLRNGMRYKSEGFYSTSVCFQQHDNDRCSLGTGVVQTLETKKQCRYLKKKTFAASGTSIAVYNIIPSWITELSIAHCLKPLLTVR